MNNNLSTKTIIRTAVFGAVMAVAPFSFADTARSSFSQTLDNAPALPTTEAQKEISDLLADLRSAMRHTTDHIETVRSFTRVPNTHSWESHALELTAAGDRINTKGKLLRRLQELKPQALPWQAYAIEQLQPMLADLASHATKAINLLNDNPRQIYANGYFDVIKKMATLANGATELISTKLDYVETRARLSEIESASFNR